MSLLPSLSHHDFSAPNFHPTHKSASKAATREKPMMKWRFFLLAILSLFAGCAGMGRQFRTFPEPSDGERARVRVVAPVAITASTGRCYDGYSAESGMVPGKNLSARAYRGRSIGIPRTDSK